MHKHAVAIILFKNKDVTCKLLVVNSDTEGRMGCLIACPCFFFFIHTQQNIFKISLKRDRAPGEVGGGVEDREEEENAHPAVLDTNHNWTVL